MERLDVLKDPKSKDTRRTITLSLSAFAILFEEVTLSGVLAS